LGEEKPNGKKSSTAKKKEKTQKQNKEEGGLSQILPSGNK
jgi:hypothetical protein